MAYNPPLEVPADLIAWMRQQSWSAFIGDMLRVIDRTGGLASWQLVEVQKMRNFQTERR